MKKVTIPAVFVFIFLFSSFFAVEVFASDFSGYNESGLLFDGSFSTPYGFPCSLPGAEDLVFLGWKHPAGSGSEQTLIGEDIESGGCGGPVVKFSGVNDTFAVFVGGRGGWIINHSFVIGGGWYGLVTDVFVSGNKLNMAYGGLWTEYILNSDNLVHFTFGTLIGMGNAHFDPQGTDQRTYFLFEPEANVEINVVRFFRVCAGVSYRFAIGVSGLSGVSDASLSGLSANLFCKFGRF
ncbi:MAG: hypothetical protein JXQ30_06410 [Spirochaetes bacterium]|nr:hypothetical protein [Spirochaetota bacterium]